MGAGKREASDAFPLGREGLFAVGGEKLFCHRSVLCTHDGEGLVLRDSEDLVDHPLERFGADWASRRRARARQLTADKDWRPAIQAWGKVLDLSSADPASTSAMAHGREEAYAAAAEAQRKGNRQTAIDLYRMSAQGLKTYKDSETRISLLETAGKQRAKEDSQRFYEKGMAAYSAKELESGKSLFEQALRANPDDKKAAKALERLKEEMGKN